MKVFLFVCLLCWYSFFCFLLLLILLLQFCILTNWNPVRRLTGYCQSFTRMSWKQSWRLCCCCVFYYYYHYYYYFISLFLFVCLFVFVLFCFFADCRLTSFVFTKKGNWRILSAHSGKLGKLLVWVFEFVEFEDWVL